MPPDDREDLTASDRDAPNRRRKVVNDLETDA